MFVQRRAPAIEERVSLGWSMLSDLSGMPFDSQPKALSSALSFLLATENKKYLFENNFAHCQLLVTYIST